MSMILVVADGRDLKVNAWNWGVLHDRVSAAALFPDEVWAPKRGNGGGTLDPVQVLLLADFLEENLLPRVRPGERLFRDGQVTDVPDDGTFYRNPEELWKNYSLRHEVLVEVIRFLREAHGEVSFC